MIMGFFLVRPIPLPASEMVHHSAHEDDEEDEAITPPSTWDPDDGRWTFRTVNGAKKPLPTGVDDDDMMKAALALCGLGGRRIL